MTVYNINLGIGWANSGVEYAQLYRSKIFQQMQQPAKFIFLDFISSDNIEHLTHNLGFRDEDVIWLYQYFTDIKIAPTTYRTDDLEQTFAHDFDRVERTATLFGTTLTPLKKWSPGILVQKIKR